MTWLARMLLGLNPSIELDADDYAMAALVTIGIGVIGFAVGFLVWLAW